MKRNDWPFQTMTNYHHEFIGRWEIIWMEQWDQKYVNLVEPGYFLFTDDGPGEFVFGAVKGWLDVRVSHQVPRLEYSWQGVSEGDDLCGRGYFEFDTPFEGEGKLFIYCGDESLIKIKRLPDVKEVK